MVLMSGLIFFSILISTEKTTTGQSSKNDNYEEDLKKVQQRVNYLYNSKRTYKHIGLINKKFRDKQIDPFLTYEQLIFLNK